MRSNIETARKVAMEILQPSARDLAHGLELHRESLVFESYSLGFQAPLDPVVVNAAWKTGASQQEVKNLVGTQQITGWTATMDRQKELKEAIEAAGVTAQCVNAGEEGNHPVQLLERLARYTFLIDSLPDIFVRAAQPHAIPAAKTADRMALYLTGNGVPLRGAHQSVEDELGLIQTFAQLGVRMMHLTYNRRNLMGDGCAERVDAGLSDFGQAVVSEMNKNGVIVDLAHSGWQTSVDAARRSQQPVIVSHSTANSVFPHFRAKSDEVIEAVLDSGGAIGLTNIPVFLGGSGDISMLLNHIDYVVRKFGDDAAMIGTDTPYVAQDAPEQRSKLLSSGKKRARWEGLWPDGFHAAKSDYGTPARVQSLAWTNWPLFTVGLVQRGHSDESIKKIIGGNMMRIARQARQDQPSQKNHPSS